MKALIIINKINLVFMLLTGLMVSGCSNDSSTDEAMVLPELKSTDNEALLFMLEEEKLARDTYDYLYNLWGTRQFGNIRQSEQSHMNAIENLLVLYNIDYEILPYGEFANAELQQLYNQFEVDGQASESAALIIGATIEDLDIVDLMERIEATENTAIIDVFSRLQCGSENHLRAFTSTLSALGEAYEPQFLDSELYQSIISSPSGSCR